MPLVHAWYLGRVGPIVQTEATRVSGSARAKSRSALCTKTEEHIQIRPREKGNNHSQYPLELIRMLAFILTSSLLVKVAILAIVALCVESRPVTTSILGMEDPFMCDFMLYIAI